LSDEISGFWQENSAGYGVFSIPVDPQDNVSYKIIPVGGTSSLIVSLVLLDTQNILIQYFGLFKKKIYFCRPNSFYI